MGVRPNIWRFLNTMKKVMLGYTIDYAKVKNGGRMQLQLPPNVRAADALIIAAESDFAIERYTIPEYLRYLSSLRRLDLARINMYYILLYYITVNMYNARRNGNEWESELSFDVEEANILPEADRQFLLDTLQARGEPPGEFENLIVQRTRRRLRIIRDNEMRPADAQQAAAARRATASARRAAAAPARGAAAAPARRAAAAPARRATASARRAAAAARARGVTARARRAAARARRAAAVARAREAGARRGRSRTITTENHVEPNIQPYLPVEQELGQDETLAALNGEEPSAALNEEPLAASNQEEPVIELDPEPVEHIVTPIRAPVFPRIPNFLDEELPVFRLPPFIPFESSFLNLLEQDDTDDETIGVNENHANCKRIIQLMIFWKCSSLCHLLVFSAGADGNQTETVDHAVIETVEEMNVSAPTTSTTAFEVGTVRLARIRRFDQIEMEPNSETTAEENNNLPKKKENGAHVKVMQCMETFLIVLECELIGCDSRRDIIKLKCKHRFCIPCIRNFMTRFCVTCREPIGNYLPDHLMGGETWTKKVDQQLDRDFYRQINNERIALETQADERGIEVEAIIHE
ncbi:hypothetical protein TKK_0019416 [Trichogramma kaykai]